MTALYFAEKNVGHLLDVHSGCRCPKHNAHEGGDPKSAHLQGEGVDIGYKDPFDCLQIQKALMAAGVERFDLYSLHLHADRNQERTAPQLLWRQYPWQVIPKTGKK